ncbi:OmpA/MotB family protein [Salidesulfovibrio brasiliensis]|uniref:OmpA/MotB family protein n=1 Tax=Salidesulfovibrio brasiliensis TaxID=221711 RepID=UPI0006D0C590|nr:flagellar motor protein MotB [Salidesulfovibrio brasiliensis]
MNGLPQRRKPRDIDNSTWALSFADMMMLIMCFFVVMLGIAEIDPNRYEAVSDILAEAMEGRDAPTKRMQADPSATRFAVEDRNKNLFELQLELAKLIDQDADTVSLRMRPDSVAISLPSTLFFKLGDAQLTSRATQILERLADPLAGHGFRLTIEGHSDNIPIRSHRYPSNWELSSARAASVARFFIDHGFEKKDIEIKGLADTKPLVANEDEKGNPIPENQARNRRVVILVRPAPAG